MAEPGILQTGSALAFGLAKLLEVRKSTRLWPYRERHVYRAAPDDSLLWGALKICFLLMVVGLLTVLTPAKYLGGIVRN